MELLEPDFGMLFFVASGFFKNGSNLLVAIFFGTAGIILIFGMSLRFAGKSCVEVLLGLSSLQFWHNSS